MCVNLPIEMLNIIIIIIIITIIKFINERKFLKKIAWQKLSEFFKPYIHVSAGFIQ